MSLNLKIGFNTKLITNSSYTKFLGIMINCTLSWNDHIDLLVKKFNTARYTLRNVKSSMSDLALNISFPLPLDYELWNHILGKLVT
jgi:hypothetical protein